MYSAHVSKCIYRLLNRLIMSSLITTSILASTFSHAVGLPATRVINFDDLATAQYGSLNVPYRYQGLKWGESASTALIALNDAHWTGAGNYNNPGNDSPSGDNLVINSGVVTVTLDTVAPFDFTGAYFAPFTSGNDLASQFNTAHSLLVEGFNGVSFVGAASIHFQQAGFVWLQADINNITQLRISGLNPALLPYQTRWAMDDFTFIPSVPAPPALLMFAAGLGLVGLRRLNTQ